MVRHPKISESPAVDPDEDLYDATPEPYREGPGGKDTPRSHSMSPPPASGSTSSDKENSSRRVVRDKGKGRAPMPPPKLPTPLSDTDRSGKRKRVEDPRTAIGSRNRRRRTADLHEGDSDDSDDFDECYDPEQSISERRALRKGLRDLTKELNDNRAEFLSADSTGLFDTIQRANEISSSVKQTVDATIDSRLLVTAADLSYKKTVQLTLGESVQGVDVDEFVSKCMTFMRRAGGAILDDLHGAHSGTQRRRRRRNLVDESDDGSGDEGDMLNWEHLGRFACLQHNSRPSVPGFLLGPLSLEKRVRKPIQRNAGLKHSQLKQTQPDVVSPEDIEKSENANLTVLCSRILGRLKKVQRDGETAVEQEVTDDMSEAEIKALMDKHGVHAKGGVDFFKFVVNPYSFGQTVENIFYVSFLIRDGKAGITIDDDGLPAVEATEPSKRNGQAEKGVSKYQTVLAIDMAAWRELISIFNIKEPMIPHREDERESQVQGKGWHG